MLMYDKQHRYKIFFQVEEMLPKKNKIKNKKQIQKREPFKGE